MKKSREICKEIRENLLAGAIFPAEDDAFRNWLDLRGGRRKAILKKTIYFKKLKKMTGYFINYCSVSVVMTWDDRLELKDAPIDKGQEVFEELISERYLIDDVEEFEDLMN